jgi:putative CocE/NonD family hydrolase
MRIIVCLCLFFSPFLAQTQNPDSLWIRENYYKIERTIPMRDGVKLFTSIYIPRDTLEKHPILLTRTPYSCRPYGGDNWNDYWNSFRKTYLKENYIMVTQDVRGKWMSEGQFEDIRPFNPDKKGKEIDEASDTWDTIDWLIKNLPHNNGRVGVWGISYPGFYSTMAAASGHPALKAVSPQAPVTNWFIGDDFHHHGAFFLMDGFDFYVGRGFGLPHEGPTMEEAPTFDY